MTYNKATVDITDQSEFLGIINELSIDELRHVLNATQMRLQKSLTRATQIP